MILTKKLAVTLTGGLGNPSKMPGKSYGLSPLHCKVGSRLRQVSGSTCSDCYACKGHYPQKNVLQAHENRLNALLHDPQWTEGMIKLIQAETYFRWHDSGDIQGMKHLRDIVTVVVGTPSTQHWLPTRERAIITQYRRRYGEFPRNLVVRLSAAMVDGSAPRNSPNTSTVHKNKKPQGYACPAPNQGNHCRDCRACWDSTIHNISYHKH